MQRNDIAALLNNRSAGQTVQATDLNGNPVTVTLPANYVAPACTPADNEDIYEVKDGQVGCSTDCSYDHVYAAGANGGYLYFGASQGLPGAGPLFGINDSLVDVVGSTQDGVVLSSSNYVARSIVLRETPIFARFLVQTTGATASTFFNTPLRCVSLDRASLDLCNKRIAWDICDYCPQTVIGGTTSTASRMSGVFQLDPTHGVGIFIPAYTSVRIDMQATAFADVRFYTRCSDGVRFIQ